jgi:hypothetical protein
LHIRSENVVIRSLLNDRGFNRVVACKKNEVADYILWDIHSRRGWAPTMAIVEKSNLKSVGLLLLANELEAFLVKMDLESAFAVVDDQIFQLNRFNCELEPVFELPRAKPGAQVVLDSEVAGHLLNEILEKEPIQFGNQKNTMSQILEMVEIVGELAEVHGSSIKFQPLALYRAIQARIKKIDPRGFGQHTTNPNLAEALANLSTLFDGIKTVFDPCMGVGTFLSEVVLANGGVMNAFGFEINEESLNTSKKVAQIRNCSSKVSGELADMATAKWPDFDFLVSEPPMGLRIPENATLYPTYLKSLEELVIWKASRTPNLRGALALTSQGWLTRTTSAKLRQDLLDSGRLRAVIGLPDLNPATSIPLVLIVLASPSAGETIVADLKQDWLEQLSPGGGLFEALKSVIER